MLLFDDSVKYCSNLFVLQSLESAED